MKLCPYNIASKLVKYTDKIKDLDPILYQYYKFDRFISLPPLA